MCFFYIYKNLDSDWQNNLKFRDLCMSVNVPACNAKLANEVCRIARGLKRCVPAYLAHAFSKVGSAKAPPRSPSLCSSFNSGSQGGLPARLLLEYSTRSPHTNLGLYIYTCLCTFERGVYVDV